MCLTIKRGQQPKVAKHNIPCFKIGRMLGNDIGGFYRGFKYTKGVPATQQEIEAYDDTLGGGRLISCVEEGYHSWKFYPKTFSSEERRVGLFIIPEGATYYEGEQYDEKTGYTSSTIVYMGHALNPLSWLRGLFWKSTEK